MLLPAFPATRGDVGDSMRYSSGEVKIFQMKWYEFSWLSAVDVYFTGSWMHD
jgi:hypothetical protein